MKINIIGSSQNKNKHKKITKGILREATRYYLKLLNVSSTTMRRMIITIDFTQKLDTDTAATAAVLMDNFSEQNTSREYEICISPKEGFAPTLQALAHELVHAIQWASGRRYNYVRSESLVRWEKKTVNENEVGYWDSPWEIESFGRQYGLYRRFINHYNEKNKVKKNARKISRS